LSIVRSLDSIGGPNHLGNLCDAGVLAVPHRAINASGMPETMRFEHAGHPFGVNNGDGRTRAELNALGFPAKHLDVGLAVQPMYYYMGHISRYVRPGSQAVMAIVEQSRGDPGFRAFRSPGQVVAGGGMNDLARNGIEVTAWPCEGSTRQQFIWNEMKQIEVSGHDWLGKPTTSCIGRRADKDYEGVTLTDCQRGYGSFQVNQTGEDGLVNFVSTSDAKCLILKNLSNGGGALGPKGGAQVSFGDCSSRAALWNYTGVTGEVSSTFLPAGEVCMTTGWPFLQIGAFDTPNGESDKTVVILNEAKDSANYVMYDEDDALLSGSIPPRSIQTILLNFD
jgi:glucosylceramidase